MKLLSVQSVKSDYLGAIASALCVVHCLATPVIFLVQSCSIHSDGPGAPMWWTAIDYLFIVIAFVAVSQSAKNSSRPFMRYVLFGTWAVLSLFILNEKFGLLPITSWCKYIAALSLIIAHIYNLRYCQCADESCCT